MRNLSSIVVVAAACMLGSISTGCVGGLAEAGSDKTPAVGLKAFLPARQALYHAAASPDGRVRSPALEALAQTEGRSAGPTLLKGLDDPAVAVQFAAAMGVGDCEYTEAKEKLQAIMASQGADTSVQCAVIYALHKLGDDTYTSKLGPFLYDGTPETRANAALVMGKIGHEAGIARLRERLEDERNPGVKLQVVESLAALRDPRSFGLLRAYARAGQPHERLLAIDAIGRARVQSGKAILIWAIRADQPPPVRLTAAQSLARMGDNRGWSLAVRAISDPQSVARESFKRNVSLSEAHRRQWQLLAALALGEMNRPQAVDVLQPLLEGEVDIVQVAAAKSIMRLMAKYRPVEPSQQIAGASEVLPTTPPANQPASAAQPTAATITTQPATTQPASPTTDLLRVAPPID